MFSSRFYCILAAASSVLALSETDEIVWSSPSEGSVYHSGDTLTAAWDPSSGQSGGSPSFRLCDQLYTCGAAVWPAVRNTDDGLKEASFIMPNITSGAVLRLWMDDFGKTSSSPEFSLSPSTETAQAQDESPYTVPVEGATQMPLSEFVPSESSAAAAVPLPEAPLSDSDSDLWMPVPLPRSSSISDDSLPGNISPSQRPWFASASVTSDLSGTPISNIADTPSQEPQSRENPEHEHESSSDSAFNGPPPSSGGSQAGADAFAPPMSQVHLPLGSDTVPTPLAPHSRLSAASHTTSFPVAALAVPLSFAALIALVAAAAVVYNRRKVSRDQAQKAAAVSAIKGNMKLLEARNTSFFSRSSVYSSGPSTPAEAADQEKTTVLGRLTARWAPSARPADVHEDIAHQRDDFIDDLATLPSPKFDEIPLSPAMPPPLHVRNMSMGELSRFTTSSADADSPVGGSPTVSRTRGLYASVSKALGAQYQQQ